MSFTTRRWCRVGHINETTLIGYTEQSEVVLIPRTFANMDEVKKGDILSFIPDENVRPSEGPRPIKFLAIGPKLIGRRPDDYRLRSNCDAVGWKQHQESAADREACH